MNLRQLIYFAKVAELGSFSRASETLRIAQPSLSQHIRNLEIELGVDLFARHARGATLHPRAHEFYEQVRRILIRLERAKESIRGPEPEQPEKVVLGLPPAAVGNVFLPVLRLLKAREPNLSIHIVEDDPNRLEASIKAGQIDVALLYDIEPALEGSDIEVLAEDLFLLVRADDELCGTNAVRFEDLQQHLVILPSRPHVIRSLIDRISIDGEIDLSVIECDSLTATAQLVVEEGRKAILPQSMLTHEAFRAKIRAVRIVEPVPSWRMMIVASEQTTVTRGSGIVARVLADVMAGQIASGHWPAPGTERSSLEAFYT